MFGAYDAPSKVYKEISIPNDSGSIYIKKTINFETQSYRVIKTAFNQFIGLSGQDELFVLMNDSGKVINTFFEYPYSSPYEQSIPNRIRSMAYQGFLVANPQKTKCIYASMDGEIIHFYDIKKNHISLIRKIEKVYPKYNPETKGESYSTAGNWENLVGYISVTASDKYIYALYSGKKLENLKDGNSISLSARQVRVFDWSGELIETYILDVDCRYINISNNDNMLWGMALMPDITPVCFNLSGNDTNKNQEENNKPSQIENTSSIPNEKSSVYHASLNNNTVTSITDNQNFPKREIGNIKVGTEFNISMPVEMQIKSLSTSSNDITLIDSIIVPNKSIVLMSIKKQKTGVFNDTITISSDKFSFSFILSGEAN